MISPLFLSAFLPVCALGLLLLRKTRLKPLWLLLFSCAFFALAETLSEPAWAVIPLLSLAAYFLPRFGKRGAAAYIVLAVGVLAVLKGAGARWPVGLSFVALQGISYALDAVKTGTARTNKLSDCLLYTLFFPKLAAGPLCRFDAFKEEIKGARVSWDNVLNGLLLLISGLSKKLLLADRLLPLLRVGFAPGAHPLACLITLIACPIYVYLDFSGYTDMARGAARILGIRLPENFNAPFSAVSMRDFWRRWHITLSAFLRDYVYIPLGGSRRGRARAAVNTMIVFLLMGLWHGAAGPYILFGLWHGALSALERLNVLRPQKWPRVLARGYALLAVAVGFVVFMAPSAFSAGDALAGLLRWNLSFDSLQAALAALSPLNCAALGAGAALAFFPRAAARRLPPALLGAAAAVLLILCYMAALAGGYAPFLYAQF